MRGWLFPASQTLEDARKSARDVEMKQQVFKEVAPAEAVTYEGGRTRIMLVDCGAKDQIARSLLTRGVTVVRVPWHADLRAHAQGVDGLGLPLWTEGSPEWSLAMDTARAEAAGLTHRPFAETVRDTLTWAQANPDQSTNPNWGLPREREQELLEAWFATQA